MNPEQILAQQLKLNFQNLVNMECFFSFVLHKYTSPYTYKLLAVNIRLAIGILPLAYTNVIDNTVNL